MCNYAAVRWSSRDSKTNAQHEINESVFSSTLSFSSSLASVLLSNVAVIIPDQEPADAKLSRLPCLFTRLLNSGDIDGKLRKNIMIWKGYDENESY